MQTLSFTRPVGAFSWMGLFLGLVMVLAALLLPQLVAAFSANSAFNSVILFVLLIGILVNFRQIWRLQRDVSWLDSYQHGELADHPPGSLAPMTRWLHGHEVAQVSLTPLTMRSILDGVQIRLDEQRDLSRYLIGLLIFLGLLGTFWGLLVTIRSVGEVLGSLNIGQDPMAMFAQLKDRLEQPLGGMATSFSTSLFGLAGSLIVGFLDLQAGHAQNRFANELEEWLANLTRLGNQGEEREQTYVGPMQAILEQQAVALERMQRLIVASDRERRGLVEQIGVLNSQLNRLADLLSQETHTSSALLATQDDLRGILRQLAARQTQEGMPLELRQELRLLTKTIAAALQERKSGQ